MNKVCVPTLERGNERITNVSYTIWFTHPTPVVVATGNGNYPPPGYNIYVDGIAFPACIQNTTKVLSVLNDSQGTVVPIYAQVGIQANYSGQFFLAPGGGDNTVVMSARSNATNGFIGLAGTSQATPHVAGLYAAIKAAVPNISVADATAWIVSDASFAQASAFPYPAVNQVYRRVRLPNF